MPIRPTMAQSLVRHFGVPRTEIGGGAQPTCLEESIRRRPYPLFDSALP